MSKYIIELGDSAKKVVAIYLDDGAVWTGVQVVEDLEVLNSDYINEHFGDLQDTAYQKGFDDAHRISEEEYQRGLEEGKKATWGLVADASSAEYQKGLNEAWECARKLFSSMADSDIEKAFPIEWNNGGFHALINLQPQEAIAKLKSYEEKQKAEDEIKVGDEVEWDNDFTGDRFIVTRIYQPYGKKEQCDGIDDDGDVYRAVLIESLVKTGRHFDIASILEDMKE